MSLVCSIIISQIKLCTYAEENTREGKTVKVKLTSMTTASTTGDKLSLFVIGK